MWCKSNEIPWDIIYFEDFIAAQVHVTSKVLNFYCSLKRALHNRDGKGISRVAQVTWRHPLVSQI
jgi:hypothetical protein